MYLATLISNQINQFVEKRAVYDRPLVLFCIRRIQWQNHKHSVSIIIIFFPTENIIWIL